MLSVIYKNWMSYIKDEAKLVRVVIPGAHNAGTRGMSRIACCQDGTLYEQFEHGIREFCIRIDTDKDGTIVFDHGISRGEPFEEGLKCIKKMLEENDSEFFIFDAREYGTQKCGPITLSNHADAKKVDALLEKYIEPSKYAFCDFDDINDVTMGDLRASGKRYILFNAEKNYKYSVDFPFWLPYSKEVNCGREQDFALGAMTFYDEYDGNGLFILQTQRTPGFLVHTGLKSPRTLEKETRPYFNKIINSIVSNEEYLEKTNVIFGDFVTWDYEKNRKILLLNVNKNNIKDGLKEEFIDGLGNRENAK